MTKTTDYFKTFCAISQAFGTAATQEALLDLVVKSAVDTLKGKAACLFLADEQKDVFVPKAQHGLSKGYLHASPLKAQKIVKALLENGHLFPGIFHAFRWFRFFQEGDDLLQFLLRFIDARHVAAQYFSKGPLHLVETKSRPLIGAGG